MIKKILSCIGCVFFIAVLLVLTILWQGYRFWLQSASESDEIVSYTIEEGAGFSTIADDLAEKEFVSSAFWFKVYGRLDGSAGSIQAGVFEIQSGLNYADLIDILVDADSEEVSVTIPEGYTLAQIGEVVAENFDITEGEWALYTGMESPLEDHVFVITADKPENVDMEGYLFPDTYRFFIDATVEEIATTMLEEMESNTSELAFSFSGKDGWPETIHEYLTLASIVEREVRSVDEMKTVAGIFYNRLEIGMALQADSTVNYVTGKDTPSVSLSDTEIDSLYNTYLYPGLPPGPISNPGLNALEAVANPTPNNYLYFLTTDEGEVIYAETFEQHVDNKNTYLR